MFHISECGDALYIFTFRKTKGKDSVLTWRKEGILMATKGWKLYGAVHLDTATFVYPK